MSLIQIAGVTVFALHVLIFCLLGKDFFRGLINPKDETVSSKTFLAIVAFFNVVVIALAATFFGLTIQEFIFFGLLSFVGLCLGLNTVISNKRLDAEKTPDVTVTNAKTVNVDATKQAPLKAAETTLPENEIIG